MSRKLDILNYLLVVLLVLKDMWEILQAKTAQTLQKLTVITDLFEYLIQRLISQQKVDKHETSVV
jgi:hypothetical protein